FFFSSRRRHTRSKRDWSSDVCSSDLPNGVNAKQLLAFLRTTFADAHCDANWGAVEAEAFAEFTLKITAVPSIQEPGGKQHDGWWLSICLRSKQHARQPVVFHRRWIRCDRISHPVI